MPRNKRTFDPREAEGVMVAVPKATLGKVLHERGMNQNNLAGAMGVTKSQVNEWINGKTHMPDDRLIQAAKVLSVPVLDLLDVPADKSPTATRSALQSTLEALRDDSSTCSMYHYDEAAQAWTITVCGDVLTTGRDGWRLTPVFWQDLEEEELSHPDYEHEVVAFDMVDFYDGDGLQMEVMHSPAMASVVRGIAYDHLRTIQGDYRDLRALVSAMAGMVPDDRLDALALDVARHV